MMGNQDDWDEIGVGQGRRVFIVDNTSDVRQKLSLSLQREGYRVSSAKSGLEALRMMKVEGFPDLIILDILLPEMDGFALAYEIRKRSNVPIIVASSISDIDIKVAALLEFAEDYVTKPFHPDELTVRIWRILTHYPSSRMRKLEAQTRNAMGCRMRREPGASPKPMTTPTHRSRSISRPCIST